MPFDPSKAKPRKRFTSSRPARGYRYEVEVIDLRWEKDRQGEGFKLDYKVVGVIGRLGCNPAQIEAEPSGNGTTGCAMVYPENARGGGGLSKDDAIAADYGKCQVWMAAVYGLDESEAPTVDEETFNRACKRPVSPLRGARLYLDMIPNTNNDGKESSFHEFFPREGGNGLQEKLKPAAETKTETKAKPQLPAKPKKTFEQLAADAGWSVHPDDSDYYMNEDADPPVLEIPDLKKLLGV